MANQAVGTAVRSRGRPPKRPAAEIDDQAVGKDTLIDATIELLKSASPHDITPVTVARACSVHPSLIRYYFGNRAQLLVAVAERMMQRLSVEVEAATTQTDKSPRSRLFARINAIVSLNDSFPNFHQLMVNEIAGSADPAARALIAKAFTTGANAYGEILRSGGEDGSFRAVDPAMLYMVVVGMAEFLPAARRQLEIATGRSVEEGEMRSAYTSFVCDLVMGGIARPQLAPAKRQSRRTWTTRASSKSRIRAGRGES